MKKTPNKYDMIYYLRYYKDYVWDCPFKVFEDFDYEIKKSFENYGGLDWWNNKNKEIK